MTPKEKAEELVDKYKNVDINKIEFCWVCNDGAKQCALIAVDECINAATSFLSQEVAYQKSKEYWYNVKIEIQKL